MYFESSPPNFCLNFSDDLTRNKSLPVLRRVKRTPEQIPSRYPTRSSRHQKVFVDTPPSRHDPTKSLENKKHSQVEEQVLEERRLEQVLQKYGDDFAIKIGAEQNLQSVIKNVGNVGEGSAKEQSCGKESDQIRIQVMASIKGVNVTVDGAQVRYENHIITLSSSTVIS